MAEAKKPIYRNKKWKLGSLRRMTYTIIPWTAPSRTGCRCLNRRRKEAQRNEL